jgi:hypothetical protein
MSEKKEMDVGVQPLDAVLNELELKNPDVVSISSEHLTHKQMQKARSGRRVSRNIQMKILRAINAVLEEGEKPYGLKHLFNYKG